MSPPRTVTHTRHGHEIAWTGRGLRQAIEWAVDDLGLAGWAIATLTAKRAALQAEQIIARVDVVHHASALTAGAEPPAVAALRDAIVNAHRLDVRDPTLLGDARTSGCDSIALETVAGDLLFRYGHRPTRPA